jgi:ADP-heptose:LPS heptosyltransferase
MKKILCIRSGALGDLFQAYPYLVSIRQAFPRDHLTILVRPAFEEVVHDFSLFDGILSEPRYNFLKQPLSFFSFAQELRNFDMIFDMQMVDRTALYRALAFFPKAWFGGKFLNKDYPHGADRFAHILKEAGISYTYDPLKHLNYHHTFAIPSPYALLVPGASSSHGGSKIWPESSFKAVADFLILKGVTPVIIGGSDKVYASLPGVNLCGKTRASDLLALGKGAILSIGNDTGPMHGFSLCNHPQIILYSKHTCPNNHGPRGDTFHFLQAPSIGDIKEEQVMALIKNLLF